MNEFLPGLKNSPLDPGIRHYYGNTIRSLFLVSALFSFVAIPIWGSLLPISIFVQILGGRVLVLLAGLMSPDSTLVMFASAIASGVGVIVVETVVIQAKADQSVGLFMLREIEVLMLLVAFYLGVKTVRSMMLGKVGDREPEHEFVQPEAVPDRAEQF
jgi:hypothetical protein